MARIAKTAFNMKVIAVKRQLPNEPLLYVDELIIPDCSNPSSKLRVFEESDYVVNVMPATTATRHYCGTQEFHAMKDTAVFINIGRGSTVDEKALIRVLKDGTIRGAALDVFELEPVPQESELWKVENLLMSPHNADLTNDMDEAR